MFQVSIHPSFHFYIHPTIHLSISLHPSSHPFVYPNICPVIHRFIQPSVHTSIHLVILLSVCQSFCCLAIYLPFDLSIQVVFCYKCRKFCDIRPYTVLYSDRDIMFGLCRFFMDTLKSCVFFFLSLVFFHQPKNQY